MDCSKVGKLILKLRKEKGITQATLANAINVSDRTISKWERGGGCPDVSLLPELSEYLGVNIEKILTGALNPNETDGGNMKKIKFYSCPTCGNAMFSTSEAEISCCGRKLKPMEAMEDNTPQKLKAERVEDDLYITLDHEMAKEHYISFAACVSYDRVLFIKLYPEQAPELRIPYMPKAQIYLCCNTHGLIKLDKITL